MAKRLRLNNATDVKRALARVANMVLNEELEAKQANTILYACNLLLGAIRVDEQQKKIEELEQMLEELKQ